MNPLRWPLGGGVGAQAKTHQRPLQAEYAPVRRAPTRSRLAGQGRRDHSGSQSSQDNSSEASPEETNG